MNGYDTVTGAPQVYNNMNRMGFNAIGLNNQNLTNTLTPGRGEFNKFVTINGVTSLNPQWQPYLGGQFSAGYFGGPMVTFDNADSPVGRLNVWEPTTIRGINSAGVIDGGINGFPGNLRMLSLTTYRDWANKIGLPGAGSYGLARAVHVTDPTVFDFYNHLIDGPSKKEWQNFSRYNLNLAQTFFNGDVGFEGVYDRQSYDNGQLVFMTDKGQALYIDVIQTMADGTTNPNFGRPFIADSPGNNRVTFVEREAKRVTAFVKHDFSKGGGRDSFVGRLLGRQQLTGFANQESRDSDSRRFIRYGSDLAFKEALYGVNAPTSPFAPVNINFDDSRRVVYPVIYLGPTLKDRTTAAGAYIPGPTANPVAKSGNIRVFDSTWTPPAGVNPGDVWNNPLFPVGNPNRISTQAENPTNYKGWVNIPFNVIDSEEGNRDRLTAGADLTRTTVSSKALVWNGYFWNSGLVGMYGWREDVSKAWTYSGVRTAEVAGGALTGPINLDPSVYRLPDAFRDRIQEQSRSWSVVAHLSQLFPQLALPADVSLFYNQSQNFAASAGRVGVYNENLGPPKGDTKDMGIRLATKDGKYSLKLNRYESNVKNASSSGANLFYLPGLITGYTQQKNVYKYQIDTNGSFDLSGPRGTNPSRWEWVPTGGMDAAQTAALEASSINAWEAMLAKIPQAFYDAYKIQINSVQAYTSVTPPGLTMTEDNVSKGYEAEIYAAPIKNLRLSFNVSKAEAMRDNVGQESLVTVVNIIHTALTTTDAGKMRDGPSATATPALNAWNANFMAQFNGLKQQEGGKVPEMREWRANFVANYDFTEGRLKGFNLGASYRWQSKVIIGYQPAFFNTDGTPAVNHILARVAVLQLDKPFYGPAEHNVDVSVGYRRKLSEKLNLRTQLNVRNVGEGNRLIPVTVQPDGTPAGYRIAPTQVWSLTSTLEF
ncbi:MAG TPA: TonB-dependent receptor [Lacunisphaera sp.]|nr:TonB-dependent receptor [Lacunisphaera sp.]